MADVLRQVYLYDGQVLRGKFTVEERADGSFISTKWDPETCLEEDRDVEVYETFSAALAGMFENALNHSLQYSNLRMYGKMRKKTA